MSAGLFGCLSFPCRIKIVQAFQWWDEVKHASTELKREVPLWQRLARHHEKQWWNPAPQRCWAWSLFWKQFEACFKWAISQAHWDSSLILQVFKSGWSETVSWVSIPKVRLLHLLLLLALCLMPEFETSLQKYLQGYFKPEIVCSIANSRNYKALQSGVWIFLRRIFCSGRHTYREEVGMIFLLLDYEDLSLIFLPMQRKCPSLLIWTVTYLPRRCNFLLHIYSPEAVKDELYAWYLRIQQILLQRCKFGLPFDWASTKQIRTDHDWWSLYEVIALSCNQSLEVCCKSTWVR